jgi:dimeric dUTPase (all-alpha-NTP-PPase superfamily)
MKKHIKSHSYKNAKLKCHDCDFVGESDITMEVHIGKEHSENFECGLCEFEAPNFENLDIHLNVCEVYQCGGCEKIFKTIKNVKDHIEKMQYSDGWHYVYHLKLDRDNANEVSEKQYRSDEI